MVHQKTQLINTFGHKDAHIKKHYFPSTIVLAFWLMSMVLANNVSANAKTLTCSAQQDAEIASEKPIQINGTDIYNDVPDIESVCGRQIWPNARIVGGRDSDFGEWPWTISLRNIYVDEHLCGAALINEIWAVTVAHCAIVLDLPEMLLRIGDYNTSSNNEPYGYVERTVQSVFIHPLFNKDTNINDIALLKFVERVPFQPNILPVCLPDNDDDLVGKIAYVSGWGWTSEEGPLSDVMKEIEVPIITNSDCEAMYKKAGYNESAPHMFICAGYEEGGPDSCDGDSGSPMVVLRERDRRFILSGVCSWGNDCGYPNQPGVYTRVSDFRDWINQTIHQF